MSIKEDGRVARMLINNGVLEREKTLKLNNKERIRALEVEVELLWDVMQRMIDAYNRLAAPRESEQR